MKAQYKEIEEKMNKTLDALYREFGTIRAGKASPSVLDRVTVDYYGAATPIQQLATISTPDPRTLMIQPWDKSTQPRSAARNCASRFPKRANPPR